MSALLHTYLNGDTSVSIYADGTKERDVSNGILAAFPESMDVKITNWCNAGCAWCHEKSTTRGKHADLVPTMNLIKQLPAGVEIAIGGGHPLSHPDFDDFVTELSNHGIICNLTVNEFHFVEELGRIERLIADDKLHGIGYSFSKTPCDWKYDNLVTHVITGVTNYSMLDEITRTNKKILLLGYKTHTGRGKVFYGKNSADVDANIRSWYAGLFHAANKAHLSFDNLAISQLKPKRLFINQSDYDSFFMGNDGQYTMYLDAVMQEYALSSTSTNRESYDIQSNIRDIFSKVANSS